ncbi:MAG: T9SS type A sorting domain-containing protein [Chitinophagaceae bacterium]|nr:T9SS type A sorting domain-containing protein [Chitinophagaceae bacterium]
MGLGGDYAYGVIFSFDPQTNTGIRTYSFDGTKRYPYGDLLFASDGGLYGMTSEGGANNGGILFHYDPLSNTLTKLVDFGGTNGTKPMGSLIEGDDGKLYGMTSAGGANDLGVVFSYRPSTGIYDKLQDFNGANGGNSQFGSFTKLESSTTKVVKVNIYGGTNPYNNPEWNNWNAFASLSSGNLHYSDGSSSTIIATLSQQTSVSDNGPSYTTTIAPQEVTRYASYSTTSRTLTISGLDNSKNYTLELYATRAGASNNTTRFIIQNRVVDIPTANNLTMKASYNALGAVSGVMTLNISGLNTYNYINGFTLTEIGAGETNTAPTVDAGPDKTVTLPVNSVQMNGSASDPNGFIASYNWTKISGPSQYNISNSSAPATTISNLVQGTYVFRLGVYDNQGAFSFDEVTVTVNPAPSSTKHVKVNLYGGVNPYNHPEWNNWNSYSFSSGTLKYSDGTSSPISAALSQQSGIADNGTTYNATMAPVEVVRYASYSTSNRTLTISGLDNSKTYNLELYASRNGATNNTTRFTISSTSIDILTDNNLSNKASFTSIVPSGGKITVNISKLNAYNYLNGFVLTENGVSSPITRKEQINSQEQVLSTSISTYPNPATDRIVLSINNNYTGQMKVEIIDLKGAVVKQFKLSKTYKGISQNYLPVNDLRRGEYLVRIQTGSQVEVRKLLKL